ncbi:MAG: hypothetical protein CSA11_00055 [Chloroflexi bacterium]|nr:MAG: hypothetical protein CSA11_00055 [Chloroflexota bacterium]
MIGGTAVFHNNGYQERIGGRRTAVWLSEQQNVETDWVGLVDVRWDGETAVWLSEQQNVETDWVGLVDVRWDGETAVRRVKLPGWSGKMFHSLAGRAVRGVRFGLICDVG